VVKRFINMVRAFDIPIGGVMVNQVIPESVTREKGATEYLRNKFEEQKRYLGIIHRDLGDLVRAYVPLFPTEIVGVDMVRRVAEALVSGEMPE
jgi:arsenite-transporting ATPase